MVVNGYWKTLVLYEQLTIHELVFAILYTFFKPFRETKLTRKLQKHCKTHKILNPRNLYAIAFEISITQPFQEVKQSFFSILSLQVSKEKITFEDINQIFRQI